MRALVVDDSDVDRSVNSAFARRCGFQVDAVRNGREALQALKRCHYAVILMDGEMPELDGLETTRCIRQLESSRQVKPSVVIAVTGSEQPEAFYQAGANYYLAKHQRQQLPQLLARYAWAQAV